MKLAKVPPKETYLWTFDNLIVVFLSVYFLRVCFLYHTKTYLFQSIILKATSYVYKWRYYRQTILNQLNIMVPYVHIIGLCHVESQFYEKSMWCSINIMWGDINSFQVNANYGTFLTLYVQYRVAVNKKSKFCHK